ncbi:MAG: sulfatase [Provencibacterium sp.]|jgi:arylsulfatase A-like enzyme|nr:sulfatase [Provencibacterium sp.]
MPDTVNRFLPYPCGRLFVLIDLNVEIVHAGRNNWFDQNLKKPGKVVKLEKPNILFILLDDMGWRDLHCTGSDFYETPHIDQLAREGMVFPNAYAACPVCSPSRASYLTGKYPAKVGVTDWISMGNFHPIRAKLVEAPYLKHIPVGEKTIAASLKEQGYATWHVGKWHLGGEDYYPERFGFEKNIGGCSWGSPYQGYFSPYGIHTLPDGPEGEYLTDRITDEAIKLIQSEERRPFFLSLCHYAVHIPIEAKEKDMERFRRKAEKMGLDKAEALVPGEAAPTGKGKRVIRRMVQSDPAYAAMLWNLDENIGRLMQALEESGKADNTLVVFTSDNGGLATAEGSPTCNLPARDGKGWMYEGGTRVPLIIRYPKRIRAGSRCLTPVTTPDFYPTFMELTGAQEALPEGIDGVSLLPLLQGGAIAERPIFWHYPHYGNQGGTPGASVVLGRYKLIEFFEDNRCELYDIAADFGEHQDIAAQQPETAARLRGLLHQWQKEVGALFPTVNEQAGPC